MKRIFALAAASLALATPAIGEVKPRARDLGIAPGVFEPSVRGSGRPISRQTTMALETEPIR
jgi:hypothetical protein